MVQLEYKNQLVQIEAGELVSYQIDNQEFIHQKGNPGWRNADTEMFPVIGPLAEADFQVQTPKGVAVQDQHGLLREMEYTLDVQTATEAVFKKTYAHKSAIKNAKYPEKSTKEFVYWPYDFQFEKKFVLSQTGLEISFVISGEKDAPFMLGYHPAFNLVTKKPVVKANDKTITLEEVLEAGSRALPVLNCDEVILKDQKELRIKTIGFDNFMLWTEVPNMICIEPITFYPYAVKQQELYKGFQLLKDTPSVFKVHIGLVK